MASLVKTFREENPLLDRLTDAEIVDVEAEHSTSDTAPGVTLEHIARSMANGRRCLLLAWPDTAESIARRFDEDPKCMRSFSGEDGAHRLYNANGDVRAGPNEVKLYRQAVRAFGSLMRASPMSNSEIRTVRHSPRSTTRGRI